MWQQSEVVNLQMWKMSECIRDRRLLGPTKKRLKDRIEKTQPSSNNRCEGKINALPLKLETPRHSQARKKLFRKNGVFASVLVLTSEIPLSSTPILADSWMILA